MPAVSPKVAPQLTQHILYGTRHLQFRQALGQFIDKEINPHVNEWETKKRFPAKLVFKNLGRLGMLGANKPQGSFHFLGISDGDKFF
ncbi:putative acyl-CoA dehydrogenase 6 [Toxocara canis]|uniref:Putative acyl-CoA dehydrogenase 6 n=1 Tax=Toxocara canis TaxID=6265 RepID=A0A0B2V6I3_TOXCA|nr:putative acyl-CoA dehydrogenase 6 [Toxocara canis]KHN76590.1 putative acyl-CoA dehydrogenase 6 [Toxocara canis]